MRNNIKCEHKILRARPNKEAEEDGERRIEWVGPAGGRALSIMKKDKNIHHNGRMERGKNNKRLEQYNFKCRGNLRNVTKIDLLFSSRSSNFFFLLACKRPGQLMDQKNGFTN